MVQIALPELGEGLAETLVIRWLKSVGEHVQLDEPLLEVETDKAIVEIPCPVAGVLRAMLVDAGSIVAVGQAIGTIDQASTDGAPAESEGPDNANADQDKLPSGETIRQPKDDEAIAPLPDLRSASGTREIGSRAAPVVRRLAEEHGVDLGMVKGSGLGGRITRDDVLAYARQRESQAAITPPDRGAASPPITADDATEELRPHTRTRRAIAAHMSRSVQTAPHAWVAVEVDMTNVRRWREIHQAEFQQRGINLTYLPIVLWVVSRALVEHRVLNSEWSEDGVILRRQVNLGVAVATNQGLIVPVIHRANTKDLVQLAAQAQSLATMAQEGRLPLEASRGGTFTVDNTGALGCLISVPIIHQPQAAILTTEAVVRRLVPTDDGIAIRDLMNLCLSFDHRVMDGADALGFLNAVKARLQSVRPESPWADQQGGHDVGSTP